MNNSIKCTACFIFGAAVSFVATNYLMKNKYEQYIHEEVQKVKDYYQNKEKERIEKLSVSDKAIKVQTKEEIAKVEANKARNKPGISDYNDLVESEGYTDYSTINHPDKKENYIHVISPNEYGEPNDNCEDGYDKIELTYYSDGYLVDENDEPIENIDTTVGTDFADHIGDYEDDSVHIRNDRLQVDYEILVDDQRYKS